MLKFSGSSCLIGGPNESVDMASPSLPPSLAWGRGGEKGMSRNEAGESPRTFGESRVAAEASAVNNSVRQGARGFVHEIGCTRSADAPEHS